MTRQLFSMAGIALSIIPLISKANAQDEEAYSATLPEDLDCAALDTDPTNETRTLLFNLCKGFVSLQKQRFNDIQALCKLIEGLNGESIAFSIPYCQRSSTPAGTELDLVAGSIIDIDENMKDNAKSWQEKVNSGFVPFEIDLTPDQERTRDQLGRLTDNDEQWRVMQDNLVAKPPYAQGNYVYFGEWRRDQQGSKRMEGKGMWWYKPDRVLWEGFKRNGKDHGVGRKIAKDGSYAKYYHDNGTI